VFQKKCLGKMDDVASRDGRTVLFVSHSMASVAAICDTALVLDAGRATFRGKIREGVEHYLASLGGARRDVVCERSGDRDIEFTSIAVRNARGEPVDVISASAPIHVHVEYDVVRPVSRVQIVCHVWTPQRTHVLATADIDCAPALFERREAGPYHAEIVLPAQLLAPGLYEISVACGVPDQHLIDTREGPIFEVSAVDSYAATWSYARQDVIVGLPMRWRVHSLTSATR
jgi:lipopolysaccharide transport system ATP-binding protein